MKISTEDMMQLPAGFFIRLAKEFLRRAYSKQTADGFYSFTVKRIPKQGRVRVEMFNHGAFVYLQVRPGEIKHQGDYARFRRVDWQAIHNLGDKMIQSGRFPRYFLVQPTKGIDCYQRCVHENDVEQAKQACLDYWKHTYGRDYDSYGAPIAWHIEQVNYEKHG